MTIEMNLPVTHDDAPVGITVLILAYNEAIHIARAIASVRAFADAVVVVDSYSTDETVALAQAAGATVLHNRFVNYSLQFQWALDNAGVTTPWIMRLDADEVIEPDLAATIRMRLPDLASDIVGINFARKHIFMGRWVRHGGRYPLILLRLWRTGQGRIEERWMDEHIVVWGGRTVTFPGGFADINLNDLTFFTDKHNRYAVREAMDVIGGKYGLFDQDRALTGRSASHQAGIKRWIKERIYNRMPLWVGPSAYFFYRAVVRLGFLDGRSGMIYHVLQGFWYLYLVNAKIFEYERGMRDCTTLAERRARLSALTGYDLG